MKMKIATAHVMVALLAFVAYSATPAEAHADPVLVVEAGPTALGPPLASPPPSRSGSHSRLPEILLGSLAVASAAAGSVFGVLALDEKNDFQKHPTFSSADSANEDAVVADVGFGAAVALGVTTLVLLLRGEEELHLAAAGSRVTFAVSPVVTQHGGGAGAVLRF